MLRMATPSRRRPVLAPVAGLVRPPNKLRTLFLAQTTTRQTADRVTGLQTRLGSPNGWPLARAPSVPETVA